ERQLEELVRFVSFRMNPRAGFISEPAVVMESRSTNHGFVGLRSGEFVIAPMRGELADETGVIGLPDQQQFVVRLLTHDHDVSIMPMGVLLTPIIRKQDLALDDLRGKRFAVDANGELYQFLALIRLRDGSPSAPENRAGPGKPPVTCR